ncbi:MAG: HAMP domain-containing sensor histidine kinase [Paracoccaceae bacterium]
MDRGDIISGAAFKAVVRAALVFLLVLVAMGLISIRTIDRLMTDQVRLRVVEMAESVSGMPSEGPDEGLVERVDAVIRSAAGRTLAYAVFDADGTRVVGNTDIRPEHGDWIELPVTLELAPHVTSGQAEESYLLHAIPVEDKTLVVGRSTAYIRLARREAIRGFAVTGFVVVLAMLAIGYLLSRRSLVALESMSAALDRVSRGEVGARVPISGRNDQIDRIARQVNAHLDQLDALFGQTRRTATAVAHDLRRPLARATLGLERALSRAEAGADARGEIEQSLADLASLQSVVASILRIARIESGDVGAMRPVDLRDVLDEVAETFAPVAEDAAQALVYARAADPLMVNGDPEMLAQLVVNLVQNAITHAGDGARITLAAAPGHDGVELSVADTGPGIPAELRERVLEPFYRMDDARSVEGNGMGMTLVKAIADRHGARLALEDAVHREGGQGEGRQREAGPGLRVRVRFPKLAVK